MRNKIHRSELQQDSQIGTTTAIENHKESLSCMDRANPAFFPSGLALEYSYTPDFL